MRGKRGQFFILTAVVISVMIFSFATISNKLTVARDYSDFYEYSDNIYKETNNVINYIVNNDLDFESNMTDFANRLSADIVARNLNTDLVFIFGNSDNLTILNLGVSEIDVGNSLTDATVGKIFVLVPGVSSLESIGAYGSGENTWSTSTTNDEVTFSFNDNIYNFQLSNYNRAMFMLKEEFNNEIYIEVK